MKWSIREASPRPEIRIESSIWLNGFQLQLPQFVQVTSICSLSHARLHVSRLVN